ncbi:hypothetical protein NITLEN_50023 [Nitrospira lenta]|uniref:Uncharacterized protein n=1 Tax=Nitrospira lenta TaxID=1436998 RepID=A0A330L995_9BACT|nr:hypothetical protein NITLEN_50023 [Nitrospira lenta]
MSIVCQNAGWLATGEPYTGVVRLTADSFARLRAVGAPVQVDRSEGLHRQCFTGQTTITRISVRRGGLSGRISPGDQGINHTVVASLVRGLERHRRCFFNTTILGFHD